jgi:hypothetical protein
VSKSDPDRYYVVADRHAAASAVQASLSPKYALMPTPPDVWTDRYWVPAGNAAPSSGSATREAIIALSGGGLDPFALLADGRVGGVEAFGMLIGTRTSQWHKPVPVVARFDGLMTVKRDDGYVVIGGRRENAFTMHRCGKYSTAEDLAQRIHGHYGRIASRICWGLRKASGCALDTHPDADGLMDPDVHDALSAFTRAVLEGLALAAHRHLGCRTEWPDDGVVAIMTGRPPRPDTRPADEICRSLLTSQTVATGDQEVWRGWSTALPHRGIGSGMYSTSRKWTAANVGREFRYVAPMCEDGLSGLVTGLAADGVDVNTAANAVTEAVARHVPHRLPFVYTPTMAGLSATPE